MTISGLLSNLTLGTEKYKISRIKKIRGWLPRRKMICIGDSTQSDPEAYGKLSMPHLFGESILGPGLTSTGNR